MPTFSASKSKAAALTILVLLALWTLWIAVNTEVQRMPDSTGYTDFRFLPVRSALSDTHTLGYPILLRAVRVFSPDLQALPAVQATLLALCIGVFWLGLQCYGFSPWSALAAAAPLFLVKHFHLISYVITEPVSGALCIATVGLTLMAVSRPRKVAIWVLLAVVLFLTYQVRPAYLFLVALVPVLGALLLLIRGWRQPWRRLLRQAALLLAASAGPFLGFSAFRWAVVGHFGLVSFGGTNAIGISLEMLDLSTIERLPPHLRPVALAMLRERQHWTRWKGEVLSPKTVLSVNFPTYDVNVWCVARPIVEKLFGPDPVGVNRRLTEMARAIIAVRSDWYLAWLGASWSAGFRRALLTTFRDSGLDLFLGGLFLIFYVGTQIITRRRGVDPELRRTLQERRQTEVSALAVIALGLFSTQMLLTVLVEPPMERYVSAAAIFLPSLGCVMVFAMAREFCMVLAGRGARMLGGEQVFPAGEGADATATPAANPGGTLRPILTFNSALLAIGILIGLAAIALAIAPANDDLPEATLASPETLSQALDRQPELATRTDRGQVTLLHLAALRDDPETIRLLIRYGARVDAADALGLTPLHWAAVRGAAGAAEALLRAGAAASRPSRTRIQPIHLAADLATLHLLLAAGANPNARDGTGGTPLSWATNVKMMHALLLAGADANARAVADQTSAGTPTPLQAAITRGDLAEAEELLAHGADPNAPNPDGIWPLAQVIQPPHFDAISRLPQLVKAKQSQFVQLLLKYGADSNRALPLYGAGGKMLMGETVTARCRKIGMKPSDQIPLLSIAAANGETEIVPLLLEAGSDLNRRSGGGMTALHWAALAGQPETVNLLLRIGATADVRDDRGQTALDLARRLGEEEVIRQLSVPG